THICKKKRKPTNLFFTYLIKLVPKGKEP
ncbi:hypothetical protein RRG08_059405, partial [Elysia crispata]